MIKSKNYINGGWTAPVNEVDIFSPTDSTIILGTIPESRESEVDQAVNAAKDALAKWQEIGFVARGNILFEAAARIETNLNELAEIATLETGKPIGEARGEAQRAAAILRYYAGEGTRSIGDVIPHSSSNALQYSIREPLGVIGIITPWNFPLAIPMWKIAPALVYGNTLVFKPAELSSITAFKLLEIVCDLFPRGVFNMVIGSGRKCGNTLVNHTGVAGISFTGSSAVGNDIAKVCVANGTKYQLEMGGKNPVVIANDADLEKAVELTVSGAMRSAGQKCTATSRVIVFDQIRESFVEALTKKVSSLKVGDPLDPDTYLGPVVSSAQKQKILDLLGQGESEGNNALVGGTNSINSNGSGFFISPTIYDNVDINSVLAQEEIFGPVVSIIGASDIDDAISKANSIRYGLSASIFTKSLSMALKFIKGVDAGLVRVNEETSGVELQAPFGGFKESSSHSKEQGRAAIEFYTRTKTVSISV